MRKGILSLLALPILFFGCRSVPNLKPGEPVTQSFKTDRAVYSFERDGGRSFNYRNKVTGARLRAYDSDHQDPWDEISFSGDLGSISAGPEDKGYEDLKKVLDTKIIEEWNRQ